MKKKYICSELHNYPYFYNVLLEVSNLYHKTFEVCK